MKDNKETKKESSIWRSRSFCVLITTLILWIWGDIAQPQATSCQVGTYDCAGQLYLYNGNVGVGTTSPSQKLDVNGTLAVSGQSVISVGATDINVGDLISGDGTRGLALRAGDLTHMYVTTVGNVGIGTTTPTEKLQVSGNLTVSGRMTAGGGYSQPGTGGETLRIVRGVVSGGGTIIGGSGFSPSRSGTGSYTITFSTPFSSEPTVVVSPFGILLNNPAHAQTSNLTPSFVNVTIHGGISNNLADGSFHFIAMGPP